MLRRDVRLRTEQGYGSHLACAIYRLQHTRERNEDSKGQGTWPHIRPGWLSSFSLLALHQGRPEDLAKGSFIQRVHEHNVLCLAKPHITKPARHRADPAVCCCSSGIIISVLCVDCYRLALTAPTPDPLLINISVEHPSREDCYNVYVYVFHS
ncbi:hypothetical protein J6590_023739 [Homalodisca vitripennis]|nr:hypothetical protein J6590_023739 [Homalodisca vitripennis]